VAIFFAPRNQAVSQLIARFKMGNEQNILPKKEYLICLFTLIIALNGKFLSNFFDWEKNTFPNLLYGGKKHNIHGTPSLFFLV